MLLSADRPRGTPAPPTKPRADQLADSGGGVAPLPDATGPPHHRHRHQPRHRRTAADRSRRRTRAGSFLLRPAAPPGKRSAPRRTAPSPCPRTPITSAGTPVRSDRERAATPSSPGTRTPSPDRPPSTASAPSARETGSSSSAATDAMPSSPSTASPSTPRTTPHSRLTLITRAARNPDAKDYRANLKLTACVLSS